MRTIPFYKLIPVALLAAAMTCAAGCGLVKVELTSSPATVKRGDPVTFGVKLTNTSQCPLEQSFAIVVPFISQADINAELNGIAPGAPPEVIAYLEALRDFLNDLCTGGMPVFPTPPFATQPFTTSGTGIPRGLHAECVRGDGEVLCTITGELRNGTNAPFEFGLFHGTLDCHVADSAVTCSFHVPLPNAPGRGGATSAAFTPLNCLTLEEIAAQVGAPPGAFGDEELGFCFLGTFPNFDGLGPNEVAAGSVTFPARGVGVQRNLVIAISDDAQDVGVCKGGSNPGDPCDRSSSFDCNGGGTCAEGICIGGANTGLGCDTATAPADCPGMGATCQVCAPAMPAELLPIDCTTTYVSPDAAPVLSPWMLLGLAAVLLATGTFWLQRRRGQMRD